MDLLDQREEEYRFDAPDRSAIWPLVFKIIILCLLQQKKVSRENEKRNYATLIDLVLPNQFFRKFFFVVVG